MKKERLQETKRLDSGSSEDTNDAMLPDNGFSSFHSDDTLGHVNPSNYKSEDIAIVRAESGDASTSNGSSRSFAWNALQTDR